MQESVESNKMLSEVEGRSPEPRECVRAGVTIILIEKIFNASSKLFPDESRHSAKKFSVESCSLITRAMFLRKFAGSFVMIKDI